MAMLTSPHRGHSLSLGQKLLRVGWPALALVVVIGCIGIATLYSVGGGSLSPWADKHATRLVLGLVLVLVMALVPLRVWMGLAYPAYFVALVALALVPLIGTDVLGARRWIRIASFSVQPSELMKLALVGALARYYQWLPPERVSRPLWVAIPLVMIALPLALVLKQPDLGTAVLIAGVGLGLMFLAGVNFGYFAAGLGSIVLLAPFLWERLHDYQRRRVLTFLDPERDPLGAGYHIIQSKIALGSGGLMGKGYLSGTQGQLNFLPEKQTDFIFTMFAEEAGFIGAAVLIALYAALVGLLLVMAMSCRNRFSRLIVAGPALIIFVYASVNISMVSGLVPVVGVPLPLVSFGGTSLMTVLVCMGLAMSGYVNRQEDIRAVDLGPVG